MYVPVPDNDGEAGYGNELLSELQRSAEGVQPADATHFFFYSNDMCFTGQPSQCL